jgi:putative IMPACT (imprinted ancient) family translation regulator
MFMEELSAGKLVETKSRFYGHLYHIDDSEEITAILRLHRTRYKKANHHCYAIYYTDDQISIERYSDDGEVGHPGRILLDILKQHQLDHHVLIISRIFGGIKLGVGGVSRAFRDAGKSVVSQYKTKR